MRRGRATGARRWWWGCALCAGIVVVGGSAWAAGTGVAVTYRIVESRGMTIGFAGSGGAVSWEGEGATMSVELRGAPSRSLHLSSGGSQVAAGTGGDLRLAPGTTDLRYRLEDAGTATTLAFVVSTDG